MFSNIAIGLVYSKKYTFCFQTKARTAENLWVELFWTKMLVLFLKTAFHPKTEIITKHI